MEEEVHWSCLCLASFQEGSGCSSSGAGLLSLLQHWVPLTGCSPPKTSHRPLPRVQSFRKRLLQCGFPKGSQILPANLHQPGVLFPQVLPRACSRTGFPLGSQPPLGTHLLQCMAPPQAADVSLLLCGPPQATGAQLPHHWLCHGLQWCLEHLLLLH